MGILPKSFVDLIIKNLLTLVARSRCVFGTPINLVYIDHTATALHMLDWLRDEQ